MEVYFSIFFNYFIHINRFFIRNLIQLCQGEIMKKRLLIVALVLLVLIVFLIIIYPIIKNNNYIEGIKNDIYKNTEIEDITYLNKDNNYYILKTNDKVIVLDLNYEMVYNISISEIYESELELVYRRNNLFYEEKISEENKIIYKFYDIITNEFVYEAKVGG